MSKSKATADFEPEERPHLPVGQCHLLVIAIDDYAEAPLYNCVADADALARVLQTHYGFQETHICRLYNADATRTNIYRTMDGYADRLTEDDSLVVYFSGHGQLHKRIANKGYWIPHNCTFAHYDADGIPNHEIRDRIAALEKARHVLLLVDSCFAGSLFAHKNTSDAAERDPHAVERFKSRWAITAGRKEPVSDGKPGQNSPFAQKLLQYLEKDAGTSFTAAELGEFLMTAVAHNAQQQPDARPLQDTGDDGGRFVFRRTTLERADTTAFQRAKASGDLDELELFLDEHENSPHKQEAKRLIKEIKDIKAWKKAEREHSIASYDDYLEDYPQGAHAETAKQRKRDLAEQKRRAREEEVVEKQRLAEAAARKQREQEAAEQKRLAEEAARRAARPQNGSVHRDGPNLPAMVFVEGGTFRMGDNDWESTKPVHEVAVPDFFIGQYPLTFEEYDAFCEATQREKPDDNGWGRGRRPVINVSGNDANAYCEWLSTLTKKRYRLPTEAEWEYAARGGSLSKGFQYAGSNDLNEVGWYGGNSKGRTQPVGEKKPNELGLYDVSGNVWEWCEDTWHDNYQGAPNNGKAWMRGGEGDLVVRGGSWDTDDANCRAAGRAWNPSHLMNDGDGFRLVRAG